MICDLYNPINKGEGPVVKIIMNCEEAEHLVRCLTVADILCGADHPTSKKEIEHLRTMLQSTILRRHA